MITLPAFFSDGMVIGKRARIWGSAAPGQAVAVSFLGKTHTAQADDSGRFEILLAAPEYGGPHTLTVGERTIDDVYVGRLWLCGGQSNMEMPLGRVRQLLAPYIKEDTRIRAFQVFKELRFDGPAADVIGKWHTATGDFLEHLYAVPYFFARALLEAMGEGIPIGLMNIAAGGTPVECWLPEEIVREYPDLYEKLENIRAPGHIERVLKEVEKAHREWHDVLQRTDKGLIEQWHSPAYSDEGNDAWESRQLLDNTGFTHGAVWFRKKIHVHVDSAACRIMLNLGRAVDSVTVYVNGTAVKSVDYQYPPCLCELPQGILKTGENLLAIRLVGNGQKPFFVPGKEYSLRCDKKNLSPMESNSFCHVPLSGTWQCRVGAEMPPLTASAWFYGHPCGAYNYMLAPVLGIIPDGVIWYQGESNVGNPSIYKELFTRFVQLLRERCGEGLPVIFTQLADFIDPHGNGENWAELREQQRQCLSIPHTAMAVAIDCGEYNDLHPLDKKTVGERLALHARKMAYGENIITNGPEVTHAAQHQGRMVIHFNHARGLWAKGGRPLLDVVTHEGSIHRVYAQVEGQALAFDTCGLNVKKIRYGWTDCPPVTLYNAHGLPASPFEIEV